MTHAEAYLESLEDQRKFVYKYRHSDIPAIAVGDLIRSSDSFNYINVVLGVSAVEYESRKSKWHHGMVEKIPFVYVRSVRYAYTSSTNFDLLNGRRSRAFKFYLKPYQNKWAVVKEVKFVEISHEENIQRILKEMEGVDTAWKPLPEGFVQEEPAND